MPLSPNAMSSQLSAIPALSCWAKITTQGQPPAPLLTLDLNRLPKAARSRSFAALLRHAPFVHWPSDLLVRVTRGNTKVFSQDLPLGHWRGARTAERDTRSIRFERVPDAELQECASRAVADLPGWLAADDTSCPPAGLTGTSAE